MEKNEGLIGYGIFALAMDGNHMLTGAETKVF